MSKHTVSCILATYDELTTEQRTEKSHRCGRSEENRSRRQVVGVQEAGEKKMQREETVSMQM